MQMKSKFIAIEGLDGSGKSTQIDLLIAHFERKGLKTKFVHFPRSGEGVFGKMVARFLKGEYGSVAQVHPQLVALMFAEDRKDFAPTLQSWLDEGSIVLMDRYVLSNIAFQCAKTKDEAEKAALRQWILEFEYQYNQIPKPDFSLFLEVPFSFTEKALSSRREGASRDYLDGKDDIHEQDFELQKAVKAEYDLLCKTDSDIKRIICANEKNEMRSIDEIHQIILKAIGE